MGSESSDFSGIPDDLIEGGAALTWRWLRQRPDFAQFGLASARGALRVHGRNKAAERALLIVGISVAVAITALVLANAFAPSIFPPGLFNVLVWWLGAPLAVITAAAFAWVRFTTQKFENSAEHRVAFKRAFSQFEVARIWRSFRCKASFWRRLDEQTFEVEAAELLAGALQTQQIWLTRAGNEYEVDLLAFSPTHGRVIVLCKTWRDQITTADVRRFSGTVRFFGADMGIIFCAAPPVDDPGQAGDFSAHFNLQFWTPDTIVSLAKTLDEQSDVAG